MARADILGQRSRTPNHRRVSMKFAALSRLAGLLSIATVTCIAGSITIDFTGSITAGSSPLSRFEILYYGTDGTNALAGFQPIYNAGTSNRFCGANATCSI